MYIHYRSNVSHILFDQKYSKDNDFVLQFKITVYFILNFILIAMIFKYN